MNRESLRSNPALDFLDLLAFCITCCLPSHAWENQDFVPLA